jgi:hypothetical protein
MSSSLQNRAALYIYHLIIFTETEGNSVFCVPETAVVEGRQNTLLSQGLSKYVFCYIVYKRQSMNNSPVIGVNLI